MSGMADSGKNRKDLKQRYLRLTGLDHRRGAEGKQQSRRCWSRLSRSRTCRTSVDVKAAIETGRQLLHLDCADVRLSAWRANLSSEILQYHVPVPFRAAAGDKEEVAATGPPDLSLLAKFFGTDRDIDSVGEFAGAALAGGQRRQPDSHPVQGGDPGVPDDLAGAERRGGEEGSANWTAVEGKPLSPAGEAGSAAADAFAFSIVT